MSSKTYPSLDLELDLRRRGARFVLGIDEVGRGSLAGPVAVGICVIDLSLESNQANWPSQLRDSKLISPKVRQQLVEPINDWVLASTVGYASAREIDELGITECLALAAQRAFSSLNENLIRDLLSLESRAILDGSHNWIGARLSGIQVFTRTKADRDCVSVACASVVAKVARDEVMTRLAEQEARFDWAANKGYSSPAHLEALRRIGPAEEHRKTWLSKILGSNTLFDF